MKLFAATILGVATAEGNTQAGDCGDFWDANIDGTCNPNNEMVFTVCESNTIKIGIKHLGLAGYNHAGKNFKISNQKINIKLWQYTLMIKFL